MADSWLHHNDQNIRSRIVLTVLVSFAGKLLGFFKLQQIAVTMGVSQVADVMIIVQQVLWFVEIVFVSSAVIPIMIAQIYQIDQKSGQQAQIFFTHILICCATVSVVFALVINLFTEELLMLLLPKAQASTVNLFRNLLVWGCAIPILLTLSHFFALTNRLSGNGVWYSVPQILINGLAIVALIIGARTGGPELAAKYMVIGVSVGAVAVIILQICVAPPRMTKAIFTTVFTRFGQTLRGYQAKHYWPGVLSLLIVSMVNEIYVYVDFYFATRLEAGSVAALGYANRLATLTNMLLVTTAFVILEPRWAQAIAGQGDSAWKRIIAPDSLTILSLIAAPIALLFWFSEGVTDLVYRSSQWSLDDQARLNSLTQIFGLGTGAIALAFITTRAVVIAGQQRRLFQISLGVLILKILLSLWLIPIFGVQGLALATILSFTSQAIGNGTVLILAGHGRAVSLGSAIRLGLCLAVVFCTGAGLAQVVPMGLWWFMAATAGLCLFNLGIGTLCQFGYAKILKRGVKKR